MTIFTTIRRVEPYDVWELEYGYTERTRERYQRLVEITRLWGFPIWRKTLGTEHVPGDVLIEVGALGSTAWRSRFAEYIR